MLWNLGSVVSRLEKCDHAVCVQHIQPTPGAFDCVACYLPVPSSGKSKLPSRLAQWAAQQDSTADSITLHHESTRLTIRRVQHGDRLLLLLSESTDTLDSKVLARFKLTPRETEVLYWLTEGKSNAEIVSVLGLMPSTIKLHIEHILAKLRVPNRMAAALFIRNLASH